jgi:hypothetical protein
LLDLRLILATLAKALGTGPGVIRRAFILPSRGKVAAVFQRNLTPTAEHSPLPQLQPA